MVRDATEWARDCDDGRHERAALGREMERRTRQLQSANGNLKETLGELGRTRDVLVEQQKLAALGSLVAGVAHEINTPLGIGVMAVSHLSAALGDLAQAVESQSLTRRGLKLFVEGAAEATEMLRLNLRRAAELISSFKQVAVDQTADLKRSFEVHKCLRDTVDSLAPRVRESRVSVALYCDHGVHMHANPGSLIQVVTNLVDNALTHAFEPGEGGIVRVEAHVSDDSLQVEVSDDGKGIAAELHSRIFEPFFTTRRGKGSTGLGMHIVHNLVTASLGGTIGCESRVGVGTTFRLSLPLGQPSPAAQLNSVGPAGAAKAG